jgi:hypothetical protein
MGLREVYATKGFFDAGSTRYLTINSSQATRIVLTSGASALSVFNQGSSSLVWGGSSIAVNSGNYLFPSSRIEWNTVQDGFSVYFISDSVGYLGIAAVTEYQR